MSKCGTGRSWRNRKNIARERPVAALRTQIFETEEQAAKVYDPNAKQKNGYRPKDKVWFKTTVDNKKLTAAAADTDMQGALLDPIIYDKLPEYIESSGLENDNIKIKWYGADGNEKTGIVPSISHVSKKAPDYGGDMLIQHNENSEQCSAGPHSRTEMNAGEIQLLRSDYIVCRFCSEGTSGIGEHRIMV
ncbi:MAG: hypothetical protein ACLT16_13255 [[Clostridium] innocuum]